MVNLHTHCRDGKFWQKNMEFFNGMPDDLAIGIIVTLMLNVSLTESFLFHSHYERLKEVPEETLHEQVVSLNKKKFGSFYCYLYVKISISYYWGNHIKLSWGKARFNERDDPTRLLSLHCIIYPNDEMCLHKDS